MASQKKSNGSNKKKKKNWRQTVAKGILFMIVLMLILTSIAPYLM